MVRRGRILSRPCCCCKLVRLLGSGSVSLEGRNSNGTVDAKQSSLSEAEGIMTSCRRCGSEAFRQDYSDECGALQYMETEERPGDAEGNLLGVCIAEMIPPRRYTPGGFSWRINEERQPISMEMELCRRSTCARVHNIHVQLSRSQGYISHFQGETWFCLCRNSHSNG